MRGGDHSQDIREYVITSEGMVIAAERLKDYKRLITGIPERLNLASEKETLSQKSRAKSDT
jgi:circadian clock protein KaiC